MAGFSGFEGNISGGVNGLLSSWQVTISRNQSDITGFAHPGRGRAIGLWDISGQASGVLDDAVSPEGGLNGPTTSITLTAQADNTLAFTAVVDQVSMSVAKAGDSSVSFNFLLASTATSGLPYTLSWS